jgi:hypothetical protein
MTDSVEKTPAFPQVQDWPKTSWSGMSLRDYFAAQAMHDINWMIPYKEDADTYTKECAEIAYKRADAMLKASKK